jgi:hypothetical protein
MNEDANSLLFFSLSECSHPSKLNVCSLSAQFFGEAGRERNKKIDKAIKLVTHFLSKMISNG